MKRETLVDGNDDEKHVDDEDDDDVSSLCQESSFVSSYFLLPFASTSRLSQSSFLRAKPRGICESRGVCSLAHND